MQKPSFDPGLTQQFTGTLRRAINKDGSFNVQRSGGSWRDIHPYLHLINMPLSAFLAVVLATYIVVNTFFALIYFNLEPGQLLGVDAPSSLRRFLNVFFLSSHTLTTVGYGNFAPAGVTANMLAALEAMVGLMGFALATGLLFGRVSKPSAKIGFSETALITDYQDRTSLQFRVVNRRSNVLLELQASVLLMTVEGPPGQMTRKYRPLALEREQVYFFPLTWTMVHPIDEASPLFGKTAAELESLQAELLILMKGFDDTFSQTVNARYSYRYDEFVWGAKFVPAFELGDDGQMVLNIDQVGKYAMPERLGAPEKSLPSGSAG
jgi:inward rectifier potassium channel